MRDPVPSAKVQSSPPTSKSVLQHVRQAHTTEVPGVPSSSEPPHLSLNFPKEFLDIKIPVTSTPIVAAPTPIVSTQLPCTIFLCSNVQSSLLFQTFGPPVV